MKKFFAEVWHWIKIVLAVLTLPVIFVVGLATVLVGYVIVIGIGIIMELVMGSVKFWKPIFKAIGLVYWFIKKTLSRRDFTEA